MTSRRIQVLFAVAIFFHCSNGAWGQIQTSRPASAGLVLSGLAGPGSRPDAAGRPATSQPFDFDADGDVDAEDFAHFEACFTGPPAPPTSGCLKADVDRDGHVDQADFFWFQRCLSGAGVPARPILRRAAGRIPARRSSATGGQAFVRR